jgi:biotin carboxylase
MSEEDLERYEDAIELALVQEYKAVLPMFTHVVETERRFYLCNSVDLTVRNDTIPASIRVIMTDCWVWDMYRPARFVPSVEVITFNDVNVERLPDVEL